MTVSFSSADFSYLKSSSGDSSVLALQIRVIVEAPEKKSGGVGTVWE